MPYDTCVCSKSRAGCLLQAVPPQCTRPDWVAASGDHIGDRRRHRPMTLSTARGPQAARGPQRAGAQAAVAAHRTRIARWRHIEKLRAYTWVSAPSRHTLIVYAAQQTHPV